MTTKVTATTAKAQLLALLDSVEKGEEFEITRRGRTIARVVPARGPHALRGIFAGIVKSVADDHALYSTDETWTHDADNIAR